MVFTLFLCSGSLYSQWGVRAGLNIATISDPEGVTEDVAELTPILGMNFGLLFEIPLSERVSIQPEIHYIQKGGKIDHIDENFWIKDILNYLEISVLGNIYLFEFGDNARVFAGLGPHIGYALKGMKEIDDNGHRESYETDFKSEEITRWDYGLGMAVGAKWGGFFADIRYNLGLSNLNEFDYDPKFYHRGLLLGVGYQF